MQGVTGTVQFAQYPGMTASVFFSQTDLMKLSWMTDKPVGASGASGASGPCKVAGCCLTHEPLGSTGVTHQPTGSTAVIREYFGSTGSTGNRYVNVSYTINANTSGKMTAEITF
jgi:hypothetical protein